MSKVPRNGEAAARKPEDFEASLAALDEHVTISGGPELRERYLSLAVFPAATPIPVTVPLRLFSLF